MSDWRQRAKPVEQGSWRDRAVPFKSKPPYNYIPPDGDNEDILIEQTGETIKAQPGTGAVIQYAQNDDTFAPAPSSFIEETTANVEKQAGYMGYLAWSAGSLSDSDAADFIAERSKALAYAQSRYPEYMKKFNEDFEAQEGIFGKSWVILNNPSAIIRSNVTQSPNGIIPLTGFVAGLGLGSFFGPGGTAVGGFTGSLTGQTAINTGARMDEILVKQGYDPSDANSLREAFSKPEVREQLVQTATASGLSQSVVESLFDMVAGKYLKLHGTSTIGKKLKAGAVETAVQSGGEMIGEGIGQGFAYGPDKIDVGQVLLEGVTTLPQSAATIAIGTARRSERAQIDIDIDDVAKAVGSIETEKQKAVAQQKKAIIAGGDDSEIRQKIIDLYKQKEEAVLRLSDLVAQKETQKEDIVKSELSDVADKGAEIREGRIKKLTDDIKPLERQLDLLEARFFEEISDGRSTTVTENKINALLEKKGQYEYEIEVMRDENLSKPENLAKKDITLKGSDLINAEKKSARKRATAVIKGFKQGIEKSKTDIRAGQEEIIGIIKESGLGREAIGLFEKEILSADTPEKAARRLPKVQEKVVSLLDQRLRDETVTKIRKAVKRAAKSRVIDVGFAQRVQMAVRDIDFTKRTESTKKKLQSALDYYEKNTDKKPPKKLLEKLKLLNKKQSGDLTTTELLGVLEEVTSLIRKGKKKQAIKKMQAKNKMESRLNDLSSSRTIQKFHVGRAPLGKRMAVMQRMKNAFAEVANKIESVRISKNSMDVFFDMLDGSAKYTGPAHRIFKKTMDRAFGNYLGLRDAVASGVLELTKKHKYTKENFDNIGAYAALMQENGRGKLLAAGLTEKELDSISLTEQEMELYKAMRKSLEKMYPKVADVMADVYNQTVRKVDNYFPFITDFDKDNGKSIDEIINRMVEPDVANKNKQKNVNKDFTISRVGGKVAIKIDAMKIFMQHVDNAAYLVEMARDIKELSELAGKKEYQDIVGDMGKEITLDWLDLLARKGRDPNAIKSIDTIRRNTGLAVLAYRISSMAVQLTALLEGATLVGGSYVSRGTSAIAMSREWRKFVYNNMQEVRDRIGDDPFWETLGGDGVWKKTQEAGMYGIKKLDHFSAASVAAGAYIRAVESKGGTVDLTKPDTSALEEAQLYMRRTQSSAFAKDMPLLLSKGKLTGSSSWDKLIFQFQSFLLNRWSIISHDLFRTSGIKPTQQSLSIATFLILANMAEYGIRLGSQEAIEAIWSSMDMGGEPPEEDEELTDIVINQALSNVPFVSSFVRSLEYGQPPVPAASLIKRGFDEWLYYIRSKDPDKARRHLLNATAILGGGAALGVPGISQFPSLSKALLPDGDDGTSGWGGASDWGEKPNWK